jgi:hypothetical protein
VTALVLGEECLVSTGYDGKVFQWALPDPKAIVEEADPPPTLWLSSLETEGRTAGITCMQVCRISHLTTVHGQKHQDG